MKRVRDLAIRQLEDYRRRTPGTYFAEEHPPLDMDEAYRVQGEIARLRVAAGDVIAGYKIGCVGPRIRQEFGMSGPIRAFVYESELRPSGGTLRAGEYENLAIEGEMAVRIGERGEIATVFPVIELHDFVFRGARKTLQELIVNNGLNVGAIVPPRECPALPETGRSELELSIDDEERTESGPLWCMPGGPEEVVGWLRRNLTEYGLALNPGQIVLTGTVLGLHPVRAGSSIRVSAGHLGIVQLEII